MIYIGIDPGQGGALVRLSAGNAFSFARMPLHENKDVNRGQVYDWLCKFRGLESHVFLERAIPMAMGSKHAFNYGRGFAALEIAIEQSGIPVTYVEPAKWTKEICAGIDSNLKPKARSAIAMQRLFPHILVEVPKGKTGKLHDGVVDALLIAEYGRRLLGGKSGCDSTGT